MPPQGGCASPNQTALMTCCGNVTVVSPICYVCPSLDDDQGSVENCFHTITGTYDIACEGPAKTTSHASRQFKANRLIKAMLVGLLVGAVSA